MKQTKMNEIKAEEREFLGKELKHPKHLNNFTDFSSMRAELTCATPWEQWIRSSAYASLVTWDCTCCKPIDDMSQEELEERLLYLLSKRPIGTALENAQFTFRLTGISRAITHQIVRHRQMAFGQQSLRVSDPGHDPIRLPQIFFEEDTKEQYVEAKEKTVKVLSQLKDLYYELIAQDVPVEQARAVLPIGITTKINVVMDLREMLKYFKARTSSIAQGEHDYLVWLMLEELETKQPKYYDFVMKQINGERG